MAVVAVTGKIKITLTLENKEKVNNFINKYKHLIPYLFNDNESIFDNGVAINSSTSDKDTTLLSVIADNIESCGVGFGHRAEPLPKVFYSDLFNLINNTENNSDTSSDPVEYSFVSIQANVIGYSDHYSASGKLTKDGIKWEVEDVEEETQSDVEEYEGDLINSMPQVELSEQDLIDLQFIYDYSDLIEVLQGFTDEGHELFTINDCDWRQYELYAVLEAALNTKSLPKEVYNDWFPSSENNSWYCKDILENMFQQFEWHADWVDGDFTERRKHISINENS